MAPVRTKKRQSGKSPSSPRPNRIAVPTKTGTPTRTPHNRSPNKKRKPGLTIPQKQALIDNLQLEITERARRLRAQYNLQAQGLRSRVEIRVNRIPISLRNMTMADLLARHEPRPDTRRALPAPEIHAPPPQPQLQPQPPPVPAKDAPSYRRSPQKLTALASPYKKGLVYQRSSRELAGPDKENDPSLENPRRLARPANPPSQILSPASSNSRLARPASPAKPSSLIARPASPVKPAHHHRGAGIISSVMEKARATRAGVTSKVTGSSNPAARTKRAAAATAGAGTGGATTGPSRTTARAARRVSASSCTSTETTSTVVRRVPPPARAPAKKKTTTATASAATRKAAAAKKAGAPARAPAPPATTRVLRSKRG